MQAHAFRFARPARTASLLASRGALVAGSVARKSTPTSDRDLPAMIDQAFMGLGVDAPQLSPAAVPGPTVSESSIEQLIENRHIRLHAGTRVAADELASAGLVAVGAADLDDPALIGHRRVDPLVFAARHPSARLTVAGDVVFRTAPTAKAWVDQDGSKVVVHPARILRIDRADPGGLVPELIAADIDQAPSGPAAWRRWQLRRVAPQVGEPLRLALLDIAARRQDLARRIAELDAYSGLLTAGVVSGSVTFTDKAASAASDH
jgi:hypothetical protein